MELTSTSYDKQMSLDSVGVSMLNFFMIIGLLRLTNLNFYLSQLLGFETEINNTGGDAFNFVNYIGVAALMAVLIGKVTKMEVQWVSGKWLFALMGIYIVNAILAPFTNMSWVIYQMLFISIGLVTHFLTMKVADDYIYRFKAGFSVFFKMGIAFLLFVSIVILSEVSVTSYLTEFNDSFVQSLDDFGIMKQRYGYFLGFMLSYAIFVERSWSLKMMAIILVLFTGFGIRSFLLGAVGAGIIFTLRHPKYFIGFAVVMGLAFYLFLGQFFELLIYDTRFYSFLNAFHIVEEYPFGVGLGGYPVYTEENAKLLFGAFYDVRAILDFVPTAPESDLVHLFGSLGLILGGLHLLIQGRLVWLSYRLQLLMDPFHKCILFYFCYMTFFGISEDNIFSINYWIFFGVASGSITYLLAFKKQNADV